MTGNDLLPVNRFLQTLEVVMREGSHLAYSVGRLYTMHIDETWVRDLDRNPEVAERLEAFVSRFGRMQDTIADKLLPRWLLALAETPGSQIEILNRAERLGVVESVERWLEARKLRNRLIHEYMEDPVLFSEDIALARDYSSMLLETYNNVCEYALRKMAIDERRVPSKLELPA